MSSISAINKTLIIKTYNDLIKNSNEFIIELMNARLNNKVLELSKKSELPVEVLFFPSSQLSQFSVELYKKVQKRKKMSTKLPEKSDITINVIELLKKMDPILYKVILDKKIDVYKHLNFNTSLYF